MKKWLSLLAVCFSLHGVVFATNECFIAQKDGTILKQEGACAQRHSPCSTFKIAISLIGFNEGILIDKTHPQWPFQKGYADFLEIWRQPHNPTTWIQHSCVWYSQLITKKLGMEQLKHYMHLFHYGNQDVSGDKGLQNGLTRSWLSSSLQISPTEQIEFLSRLKQNRLPVSSHAMKMTRELLFVEELPGHWRLYGKTGAGNPFNEAGARNTDKQLGWFVGWIEKKQQVILFAQYLEDDAKPDFPSGKHAREIAKEQLTRLSATNQL
ncbi:MAG: class D beta-lactamase [Legionella sp.]